MKRKFKMNNLDCANCAAKMENAVSKIEGVLSVSVNFMMRNMTLEAADDKFDEILEKAKNICKKIEPDCEIVR